jgi:hypothetical protein
MRRLGPRLCENSEVQFARGNSVSIFVDLKTNNAGTYHREKTIEKTILRILGPCTFSHSLGPKADSCTAATTSAVARLFDHLVGAAEERKRERHAEHLGGDQVDDQLHFHRLLD